MNMHRIAMSMGVQVCTFVGVDIFGHDFAVTYVAQCKNCSENFASVVDKWILHIKLISGIELFFIRPDKLRVKQALTEKNDEKSFT